MLINSKITDVYFIDQSNASSVEGFCPIASKENFCLINDHRLHRFEDGI
jgi:hypothetical protein